MSYRSSNSEVAADGDGPHCVAVSPDGQFTSPRVASRVAVSSYDWYAFVTQEGVSSELGAGDVIYLRSLAKVPTIAQQAVGSDFWKTTAAR